MVNNIDIEEIINVINDYVKDNYEYNYADITYDTISYHYTNEKGKEDVVNIYVNLESECE